MGTLNEIRRVYNHHSILYVIDARRLCHRAAAAAYIRTILELSVDQEL
jgi:hypothetical protein